MFYIGESKDHAAADFTPVVAHMHCREYAGNLPLLVIYGTISREVACAYRRTDLPLDGRLQRENGRADLHGACDVPTPVTNTSQIDQK